MSLVEGMSNWISSFTSTWFSSNCDSALISVESEGVSSVLTGKNISSLWKMALQGEELVI